MPVADRTRIVDVDVRKSPWVARESAIEVGTNYASSLKIIDTVVTGARCGVETIHNTTIRNSKFLDSIYHGVRVRWNGFDARVNVKNSEASGNGTFGLSGTRMTIKDSVFNDNGEHGVAVDYAHDEDFPAKLTIKGSQANGNQTGIGDTEQKSTSITDCTITGNSLRGLALFAERSKVRGSTVTGNGFAAECSDPEMRCADVSSWYEPSVRTAFTSTIG